MKKIIIKRILSRFYLLPIIEQIKFFKEKWKHKKDNNQFKKENPNVKLPPDFYMYETFNLNYKSFYTQGRPTAEWLINHVSKFKKFDKLSILDWGCGTSRVLRHLPEIISSSNSFYGTDYNKKYVKWCSENLEGINFKLNKLNPPLDFSKNSFDFVYGISIFTHLSEKLHYDWMNELARVLKNEGILFLTTHGDIHSFKLTQEEKRNYKKGNLIVHSFKKEGNRLYASYQSPVFFEKLCKKNNFKVLEHIPGDFRNNKPQQDVWILQIIKN
jgi:SAM-dependent methyltransferase